ncbi:Nn.00g050910.m01.CDS01 [Neocucurbitaria sp. VM-36]
MGNFRSKSGCLTCRARRVKCDETHPVCKSCSKKNRPCQWEPPHTKFKGYQPGGSSSTSVAGAEEDGNVTEGGRMELDGLASIDGTDGGDPFHGEDGVDGVSEALGTDGVGSISRSESSLSFHSRHTSPRRRNSRTGYSEVPSASVSSPSAQASSPRSAFLILGARSLRSGVSAGSLHRHHVPNALAGRSHEPIPLTHHEALLVHHYTEHLGRWLDCTDATRQFTLGAPEKVKSCPVLLNAVLSFAARHRREDATAAAAYQRCIALLIERLNEDAASHDETLLCAIVILRFYEQLNVPSSTGSDDEQHLAGCSAIIRTSQGHHFVDPSAPTLREAAFWVYVRQCLYNATINQQPPDVDFSLQLHPAPGSMHDSHPLAHLKLETAWANQMTWNTARVANFCFEGNEPSSERTHRVRRWQELWDLVEMWANNRPAGFNPIYEGKASENGVFPEIWFTADWHVVSFGFYHFACILLLSYKPGPKFAIRNVERLSDSDRQILEHSRAICGACKSSPETVPLLITLCHTIFIWGPLVSSPIEREEVIELLVNFETIHLWPTTWIINALKGEWGLN